MTKLIVAVSKFANASKVAVSVMTTSYQTEDLSGGAT
jgi:hypothetical protein